MTNVVDTKGKEVVAKKMVRLNEMHKEMYTPLQALVNIIKCRVAYRF